MPDFDLKVKFKFEGTDSSGSIQGAVDKLADDIEKIRDGLSKKLDEGFSIRLKPNIDELKTSLETQIKKIKPIEVPVVLQGINSSSINPSGSSDTHTDVEITPPKKTKNQKKDTKVPKDMDVFDTDAIDTQGITSRLDNILSEVKKITGDKLSKPISEAIKESLKQIEIKLPDINEKAPRSEGEVSQSTTNEAVPQNTTNKALDDQLVKISFLLKDLQGGIGKTAKKLGELNDTQISELQKGIESVTSKFKELSNTPVSVSVDLSNEVLTQSSTGTQASEEIKASPFSADDVKAIRTAANKYNSLSNQEFSGNTENSNVNPAESELIDRLIKILDVKMEKVYQDAMGVISYALSDANFGGQNLGITFNSLDEQLKAFIDKINEYISNGFMTKEDSKTAKKAITELESHIQSLVKNTLALYDNYGEMSVLSSDISNLSNKILNISKDYSKLKDNFESLHNSICAATEALYEIKPAARHFIDNAYGDNPNNPETDDINNNPQNQNNQLASSFSDVYKTVTDSIETLILEANAKISSAFIDMKSLAENAEYLNNQLNNDSSEISAFARNIEQASFSIGSAADSLARFSIRVEELFEHLKEYDTDIKSNLDNLSKATEQFDKHQSDSIAGLTTVLNTVIETNNTLLENIRGMNVTASISKNDLANLIKELESAKGDSSDAARNLYQQSTEEFRKGYKKRTQAEILKGTGNDALVSTLLRDAESDIKRANGIIGNISQKNLKDNTLARISSEEKESIKALHAIESLKSQQVQSIVTDVSGISDKLGEIKESIDNVSVGMSGTDVTKTINKAVDMAVKSIQGVQSPEDKLKSDIAKIEAESAARIAEIQAKSEASVSEMEAKLATKIAEINAQADARVKKITASSDARVKAIEEEYSSKTALLQAEESKKAKEHGKSEADNNATATGEKILSSYDELYKARVKETQGVMGASEEVTKIQGDIDKLSESLKGINSTLVPTLLESITKKKNGVDTDINKILANNYANELIKQYESQYKALGGMLNRQASMEQLASLTSEYNSAQTSIGELIEKLNKLQEAGVNITALLKTVEARRAKAEVGYNRQAKQSYTEQYKEGVARYYERIKSEQSSNSYSPTLAANSSELNSIRANALKYGANPKSLELLEKDARSDAAYEQLFKLMDALHSAQMELERMSHDSPDYSAASENVAKLVSDVNSARQYIYGNELFNVNKNTLMRAKDSDYDFQLGLARKQTSLQNTINTWKEKNQVAAREFAEEIANIESKINSAGEEELRVLQREVDALKAQAQSSGLTGRLPTQGEMEANIAAARALEQKYRELMAGVGAAGHGKEYADRRSAVTDSINKAIGDGLPASLKAARTQLSALTTEFKSAGIAGQNVFTNLDKKIKTVTQLFIGGTIVNNMKNSFEEAYRSVTQLDSAFTNIAMTMPMTADSMDKLKTSSINLSKELGVSLEQVMSAAQIYANATITADEIIQRSRPTALLASASGMTTTQTSDLIQGALYQFNMEDTTDNLMKIVDVVESISASTGVEFRRSIEHISSAIQESGAIAASSGYSIEEYAATIGALVEKTRKSGSEVANSLKMIFARLGQNKEGEATEEDISKAEKAYRTLGIELRKDKDTFYDIPDILKKLSAQWSTLTDVQKSYIAETSAGNRNRSVFISLMDSYATQMSLAETAINSEGFALEANEKKLQSYETKMAQFSAASQGFWNNMVDTSIIKLIIDGGTAIVDLSDKIINGGLFTAISDMVGLSDTFGGALQPINAFLDELYKAQPLIVGLATIYLPDIAKELMNSDSAVGHIMKALAQPFRKDGGLFGIADTLAKLEAVNKERGIGGILKAFADATDEQQSLNLNAASLMGFSQEQIDDMLQVVSNVGDNASEIIDGFVDRNADVISSFLENSDNLESAISLAEMLGFSDEDMAQFNLVTNETVESVSSTINDILGIAEDADTNIAETIANIADIFDNNEDRINSMAEILGLSDEQVQALRDNLDEVITAANSSVVATNTRTASTEEHTAAQVADNAATNQGTASNVANSASQVALSTRISAVTKALWAQVAAWAATPQGIFTIATTAVFAIGNIVSAFDSMNQAAHQAMEEAKKAAKSFTTEAQKMRKESQAESEQLSELLDKYSKLANGVNKLGYNLTLTTTQYEQYRDIVSQIAELNPSLISGYNDQGTAVVELGKHYDEITKKAKEAQKAMALEYYQEHVGEVLTNNKNSVSGGWNYQSVAAQRQDYENAINLLRSGNYNYVNLANSAVYADGLVNNYIESYEGIKRFAVKPDEIEAVIDVLERERDSLDRELQANATAVAELMRLSNETYYDYTESEKVIYDSLLSSLMMTPEILAYIGNDVVKLQEISNMINETLKDPTYNSFYDRFMELQKKYSLGEISPTEYYNQAAAIKSEADAYFADKENAIVLTVQFDLSAEQDEYKKLKDNIKSRFSLNSEAFYSTGIKEYIDNLSYEDLKILDTLPVGYYKSVTAVANAIDAEKRRLAQEAKDNFTISTVKAEIEAYKKGIKELQGYREKSATMTESEIIDMMLAHPDFDWEAYGVTGQRGVGRIAEAIDALIDIQFTRLMEAAPDMSEEQKEAFERIAQSAKSATKALSDYKSATEDIFTKAYKADELTTPEIMELMDKYSDFDWESYGVNGLAGVGNIRVALFSLAEYIKEQAQLNIVATESTDAMLTQSIAMDEIEAKSKAAAVGVDKLSSAVNKLKNKKDTLKKIADDMQKFNGKISADTISSIVDSYPELEAAAMQYLTDLDADKFLAATEAVLKQEMKDAKDAMREKYKYNAEYYKAVVLDDEEFIKKMQDDYKVDLKNCKTYAEAKRKIFNSTLTPSQLPISDAELEHIYKNVINNDAYFGANGVFDKSVYMAKVGDVWVANIAAKVSSALNALDGQLDLKNIDDLFNNLNLLDSDELNKENEFLKDMLGLYDEILGAISAVGDARTKQLDKEIEQLQKKNDEEKRAIDLAKLRKQLDDARNNKTIREYRADIGGFVWAADKKAIAEAERALKDAEVEAQVQARNDEKDAIAKYVENFTSIPTNIENAKKVSDAVATLGLSSAEQLLHLSQETANAIADDYQTLYIANSKKDNAEKASQYSTISPDYLTTLFGKDFIASSQNLVNNLSGSNFMTETYVDFVAKQKEFVTELSKLVDTTKKKTTDSTNGVYIENLTIKYSGESIDELIKDALRISTVDKKQ